MLTNEEVLPKKNMADTKFTPISTVKANNKPMSSYAIRIDNYASD